MNDRSHDHQEEERATSSSPLLSNRTYNTLKLLAVIILPALGTFYYSMALIWAWGGGEEVVASIVAVNTFLGVLIKLGDSSYNASEARFDGAIRVGESGVPTEMMVDATPEDLLDKGEVILKVNSPGTTGRVIRG